VYLSKNMVGLLLLVPFFCSANELLENTIEYDEKLNIAYHKVVKRLYEPHKSAIQKAQRLWVKYRNTTCEFEVDLPRKGHWIEQGYSNSQSLTCISKLTLARTNELNAYLESTQKQQVLGYQLTINQDAQQNKAEDPAAEVLSSSIQKLNLKGESLYANKQYYKAFDVFEAAIELAPDNIRALNNLSIVSIKLATANEVINALSIAPLKVNYTNEAVIAAGRVIFSLPATAQQKSAALFNMGLACEGKQRRWIATERKAFCSQHSIEFYAHSFITYPTKHRAEFLVDKLTNAKATGDNCIFKNGLYKSHFKRKNQYVFIHELANMDKLSGTVVGNANVKINLTRTATARLNNKINISTYWANTSQDIVLNELSCERMTGTIN
jgi:uncharacterized protein YecT (DUF1311 family)